MGVCIYTRREGDPYAEAAEPLNGLAGCKDMFRNLANLPHTYARWPNVELGDCIVRPTDFAAWRAFVSTLPNQSAFTEMLDRVERDPALWLDFSY